MEKKGNTLKVIYMLHNLSTRVSTKRCAEDTDDPLLVVSLEVGKCTFQRMLVDMHRAVNILFHDVVAQMGILDFEIWPCILPSIGFT